MANDKAKKKAAKKGLAENAVEEAFGLGLSKAPGKRGLQRRTISLVGLSEVRSAT
jgi:hypothetical protein